MREFFLSSTQTIMCLEVMRSADFVVEPFQSPSRPGYQHCQGVVDGSDDHRQQADAGNPVRDHGLRRNYVHTHSQW